MPGDVSGSAISAVLPKYMVLRHRSHRVISAVNIPYLLLSFQHLLILYGLLMRDLSFPVRGSVCDIKESCPKSRF